MKLLILTTIFMTSLSALAANPTCLDKADKLIDGLEAVYKDVEGPIIGDIAFPKYQKTIHPTNGDTDTVVSYQVPHQDVSQKVWFTNYKVRLNNSDCSIESYDYIGVSDKIDCMNLHVAKDILKKHLDENVVGIVPVDDFYWLDVNDENSILTPPKAFMAVDSLHYDASYQEYKTDVIFQNQCAAGADCWGGYVVSCKSKNVVPWTGRED